MLPTIRQEPSEISGGQSSRKDRNGFAEEVGLSMGTWDSFRALYLILYLSFYVGFILKGQKLYKLEASPNLSLPLGRVNSLQGQARDISGSIRGSLL